jgi:hypothetical protein
MTGGRGWWRLGEELRPAEGTAQVIPERRFSDQDRGASATGIKHETTRSVQDNGSR